MRNISALSASTPEELAVESGRTTSDHEQDASIEGEVEENLDDEYRPSKKQAVSNRRTGIDSASGAPKINKRSRIGKLARLNSIPTDVFLEIASHLQPLDILRMARTTKAWRALLMSKSSKPIWRAARSSIPEMPDCPEDLSEAQYVRLMFGNDCYVCGTKNVPWTSFELRVRVCKACGKENVVRRDQSVTPYRVSDGSGGFTDALELLPHCIGGPHTRRSTEHFFKSDVERMVQLLQSKSADNDRAVWLVERRASIADIQTNARALRDFHFQWRKKLSGEYDEASNRKRQKRSNREAEIVQRFVQLGYDKGDVQFCWKNLVHVQVAQVLTEKTWIKIRPALEAEVIENRDKRVAAEKAKNLRQRRAELMPLYNGLPLDIVLANGASTHHAKLRLTDFYRLPSIYPLWNDRSIPITSEDWPADGVLHEEIASFWRTIKNDLRTLLADDMKAPFPGLVEEASILRNIEVMKDEPQFATYPIFRGTRPNSATGEPPLRPSFEPLEDSNAIELPSLEEPSTVFACSKCNETLLWPTMLAHVHYRDNRDPGPFDDDIPWSPDFVYTSSLRRAIAAQVIATYGQLGNGPLTVTTLLTSLKIECRSCNREKRWMPMSWGGYVKHVVDAFYLERLAAEVKRMRDCDELAGYSTWRQQDLKDIVDRYPCREHDVEAGSLLCSITAVPSAV